VPELNHRRVSDHIPGAALWFCELCSRTDLGRLERSAIASPSEVNYAPSNSGFNFPELGPFSFARDILPLQPLIETRRTGEVPWAT
jgi:hypothetical protein